MPWVYFGLATGCLAVAFRTHSLGLAGLALIVALVLMLMGALSLVSARIESKSQSASALLGSEQIAAIKRRREAAARTEGSVERDGNADPGSPANGSTAVGGGDGGDGGSD